MTWARPLAFALLALVGAGRVAAQPYSGPLPYYSTPEVVNWAETGRFRPPVTLPPTGDTVAQGWRMEVARSVQATPAQNIWDGLKSGVGSKIKLNPVTLAKGAARQIGYGVLQGVGIQLAFSAIDGFGKWLFNQSADAFGNDFRNCINVGKSEGMSFGAGMTCSFIPTVANAPHGPWPTPAWSKEIYWIKNAGVRSLSVIAQGVNDEYSASKPVTHVEVRWFCPSYMGSQRIPLSDVDAFMNQVIEYCYEAPGPVPTPIPLQTWVDGGKINDVEVPPHPEIKQDIKDALDKYFKTAPVDLTGANPMWPDIMLEVNPTKNQVYGTPIDPDQDLDVDGWSDAEEVRRGSDPNNKQSVPDLSRDTDGDGVADGIEDQLGTNPYDPESKPDPAQIEDLDGDGIPNADDPDIDGDGVLNENDPEPENAAVPVKCDSGAGLITSADGKTCVPETNPDGCPNGYKLDEAAEPPKCVPDESQKDSPVGDECGNFGVKRLLTHTGHYLRDVVFPCKPLDWSQLSDTVTKKFPFSVVSSIKDSFQVDASGGGANPLPTKLGPFEFDLSFADGFFSFIRLAFRAVIWWLFFGWLAGRLSGQVVLS